VAAYSQKQSKSKAGSIDLGTLIDWVNESEDATTDSRGTSEKCRDYYDSKQWTDSEVKALNRRKQAATVINRVKPKVDGLLGLEKTQRTTAKCFPRTPKHDQAADAATEAIRYVLQDNFFNELRSQAFENIAVEGTGGLEVVVKEKNDEFKICLYHIFWDRIIYDPHSRRKDFSDARYLGQVVWMDYDEAVDLYPEGKDILEDMLGSTGNTYEDKPRWMDTTRRRVKIVELYYHESGDVKYACFTRGGYLKGPSVSPYVNEEGETEWPYEFASAFVDREGGRYGAVMQYLDVQDEINKRRSKALHLMSVRQIRIGKGSVDDVNKVRQELAKPDGVIEVTPGMEKDFELLKTGDMAQAQFNLLAEAKQEIDAVGYNAAVSGKDDRGLSGVALRQRQMSGQTELAPIFDVLKHLDHRVYRKVWNRIKQYWKEEKWIRVTDDEQNLKWVGLNKPVTKGEDILRQAQESGLPPDQLAQLQMRLLQDPLMQEKVSTENDLAKLDVDLVIHEAPDAVTTQIEDFQVLGEMVKSGFPMPPEAVIMASPLSHKDRILKMMKEQPQLPPEIQEQMKKMQEEGQKLAEENQKLKTDQSAEFAKLEAEKQKMQEQLKLEREKAAAEIQLAREKAAAEIQLEREKAAADIELERAKASAGIEVEQEKIRGNVEVQREKVKGDKELREAELGVTMAIEDSKNTKKKEESDKMVKTFSQETQKQMEMMAKAIVKEVLGEMKKPKMKKVSYKGKNFTVQEKDGEVTIQ
jgi:hypothetical protein